MVTGGTPLELAGGGVVGVVGAGVLVPTGLLLEVSGGLMGCGLTGGAEPAGSELTGAELAGGGLTTIGLTTEDPAVGTDAESGADTKTDWDSDAEAAVDAVLRPAQAVRTTIPSNPTTNLFRRIMFFLHLRLRRTGVATLL